MKTIRKKMENKGFTLVEIIVCLAIMTIVAGSVGAFIVAGNNSYLLGKKELTVLLSLQGIIPIYAEARN